MLYCTLVLTVLGWGEKGTGLNISYYEFVV